MYPWFLSSIWWILLLGSDGSMCDDVFYYSLVKLLGSKQQNIMFVDNLIGVTCIFLWWWFLVILGIHRFPSSHSVSMNVRAWLTGPFPTLFCLTTTGHLGWIFSSFFLWLLVFLCDYLWSIFIWLVPVFSSVILGILRFSSSHSMFMNIRAWHERPF